jgi:hypothetical protein
MRSEFSRGWAESLKGVGRCPICNGWAKSTKGVGCIYVMDGPKVKMVMADNQSSAWANIINSSWLMIMCGSAYSP